MLNSETRKLCVKILAAPAPSGDEPGSAAGSIRAILDLREGAAKLLLADLPKPDQGTGIPTNDPIG